MVFLGTPFHGCDAARWASIFLSLVQDFVDTEPSIMKELAKKAEELQNRLIEFSEWLNHTNIPVVCFFETLKTEKKGGRTLVRLIRFNFGTI